MINAIDENVGISALIMCICQTISHPVRHFVSVGKPVMVVKDHDGGHNTGGHHKHDAVEVGP